jgi:hypothetical protein
VHLALLSGVMSGGLAFDGDGREELATDSRCRFARSSYAFRAGETHGNDENHSLKSHFLYFLQSMNFARLEFQVKLSYRMSPEPGCPEINGRGTTMPCPIAPGSKEPRIESCCRRSPQESPPRSLEHFQQMRIASGVEHEESGGIDGSGR